jgi:hypothetical protein
MGQYHRSVCIQAEEGLDPPDLDNGLKEGEQGFSRPGAANAIVAVVCARGGNMPADCSQSPLIGRWAGKRVLVQGKYATDDDIPGWSGPRLSRPLYAMRPVAERRPKKNWRNAPVFADITREAGAFLKTACNLRYFEQEQVCIDAAGKVIDRWTSTHSVQVKPTARHFGNCGVAEYVIADGYTARDLEYLKRCGMEPEDVQRSPPTPTSPARLQDLRRLRLCSECHDWFSGLRRPAPRSKRRPRHATCPSAKAGPSAIIARWPKSSQPKRKQPDAFTLRICRSEGPRQQKAIPYSIDHITPLGCVPGGLFAFLGRWRG